jgi:hypothetical protein
MPLTYMIQLDLRFKQLLIKCSTKCSHFLKSSKNSGAYKGFPPCLHGGIKDHQCVTYIW